MKVHPKLRIREDGATTQVVRSSRLLDLAAAVELTLRKHQLVNSLVGVAIEKSSLFVSVAIGVYQSGNAFIALDSNSSYALTQCERFKVARVVGRRRRVGEISNLLVSNPIAYEEVSNIAFHYVLRDLYFSYSDLPK